MKYCKTCLIPDTRPNGKFNEDGICIPCEFAKRSEEADYDERLAELRGIISSLISRRKKRRWQCIVGVSGGKEHSSSAMGTRKVGAESTVGFRRISTKTDQ